MGYATPCCIHPPRYMKCAGPHLTITCRETRDTPATCAYCKGWTESEKIQNEDYKPAPPPSENKWTKKPHTQQENRRPNARNFEEKFPLLRSQSGRQQPQTLPIDGDQTEDTTNDLMGLANEKGGKRLC
ncbi:hypothetical protein JTB14_001957 [Gonioctena quinquepunctata]|nr:hypothetical protein JTB14_001957 [Gonioctena quinquepunctata]